MPTRTVLERANVHPSYRLSGEINRYLLKFYSIVFSVWMGRGDNETSPTSACGADGTPKIATLELFFKFIHSADCFERQKKTGDKFNQTMPFDLSTRTSCWWSMIKSFRFRLFRAFVEPSLVGDLNNWRGINKNKSIHSHRCRILFAFPSK